MQFLIKFYFDFLTWLAAAYKLLIFELLINIHSREFLNPRSPFLINTLREYVLLVLPALGLLPFLIDNMG